MYNVYTIIHSVSHSHTAASGLQSPELLQSRQLLSTPQCSCHQCELLRLCICLEIGCGVFVSRVARCEADVPKVLHLVAPSLGENAGDFRPEDTDLVAGCLCEAILPTPGFQLGLRSCSPLKPVTSKPSLRFGVCATREFHLELFWLGQVWPDPLLPLSFQLSEDTVRLVILSLGIGLLIIDLLGRTCSIFIRCAFARLWPGVGPLGEELGQPWVLGEDALQICR